MDDLKFNFEDDDTFQFGSNNDDTNDELNIKSHNNKGKLKIKKSKPKLNKPQRYEQPVKQTYNPQPVFQDKTFESFSNPSKRMPPPPEIEEDDEEEEGMSEQSFQNNDQMSDMNDDQEYNGGNEHSEVQPSEGFSSIDDEKEDILFKLHRIQNKGVKISKKFNMYSDIREMRSELKKICRDSELNSSLKFSKRMLMAVVSGSEFLNKRYDPFGVELNGWSETVMENVNDGDYDGTFERLHDKYAGKVNTPPEIELLLSLAGSAAMFHMTSSMFKSVPNLGEMARQNPDMQKAMKSMADSLMKAQSQPQSQPQPSQRDDRSQFNNESINDFNEPEFQQKSTGRREMKGPSMDLSNFGNVLPPPQPSRAMPKESPIYFEDSDQGITSSEESNISVRQVSVTAGGTRRGRKSKINATKENTIEI